MQRGLPCPVDFQENPGRFGVDMIIILYSSICHLFEGLVEAGVRIQPSPVVNDLRSVIAVGAMFSIGGRFILFNVKS